MSEIVKNGVNHSDAVIEEDHEEKPERHKDGKWKSGQSGNPNGRPKGNAIVDEFRANPKGESLIENIFKIAGTLGTSTQHKDAMTCAKLVIERLIPSLKSSELKVEGQENLGFVYLPEQKPVERE
tara:strand:- start:20322 stop:20696 length:375 start_codon:yes stop_codon:yes gene_type:complete